MSEFPDIIAGISRSDLFEKFKMQLQKDFEGAGLSGDFSQALIPDYDTLLQVLELEVEKVSKSSGSKLTGLLYRIDIGEHQIKKLSNEKKGSSINNVIAELILKRELQKIVIKEHFKNNE